MILLVPEINFFNFILFLSLSFRYKVKAYKIQPFLYRLKSRIKLLDVSDYFTLDKYVIIRSEAMDILENILPRFPLSNWKLKIRGFCIDLSIKAKQELHEEVEKLLFLKHTAIFFNEKKEMAKIINSLKFDFLLGLDQSHELFYFPTIKWISIVNIFLGRINLLIDNLLRSFYVMFQFIFFYFKNENINAKVRYIYDGISPRDLSIDKGKITFLWLLDERVIHKSDIVFLLPAPDFQMKSHVKDYTKYREFFAVNRRDILKMASRKKIRFCFPEMLKIIVRNVLFPSWRLEYLLVAGYAIRIIRWIPLIESLKPEVYITSASAIGIEDPVCIYFKAIGIKTILWTYGTNTYLFCRNEKASHFRSVQVSHIISANLIVWNEHYREFITEHPQDGIQIRVIGPLMSGDENVMYANRSTLFEKFNVVYNRTSKYIAIFDSPPISPKYRNNPVWSLDQPSEKYNYKFMKDMNRLLFDFQNIILVYKPKRSLISGKFLYARELKELLDEMVQNQKMIILDYNINPWIPIAIADICISMPFESPTIAAIHYGKIGLFHDPENIALYHRYHDFPELVTHTYEQLKLCLRQSLCEKKRIGDIINEQRLRRLQGAFPKENSSEKFRDFLKHL